MLKLYSVTNKKDEEILVRAANKIEAIYKAKKLFIANGLKCNKLTCEEVC